MAQLRSDFQEMLRAKEEQEELLHRRERELNALKGALKDEVETHDNYMAALKDEYEIELKKLLQDFDLAKEVSNLSSLCRFLILFFQGVNMFSLLFQSNTLLGHEKGRAEEERVEAKVQLKDLLLERDQLRGKVQEQSSRVDQLNQAVQEGKTAERLLEQRAKQLEVRGA